MERRSVVLMIVFLAGSVFSKVNAFSGCTTNPIDIVFLLDGSGSVGQQRFNLVKDFVLKLLLRLSVGQNTTRVALMQFSGKRETKFEFEINDYDDLDSMSSAIKNIKYHYGGLQQTGLALKMIGAKVFNGDRLTDRPWAENVVVLITEGPSTFLGAALKEAEYLKKNGVRFVAVGVGARITSSGFRNELEGLASSYEDLFFSKDENIMKLIEMLSGRLCPNISVTASVRSTPTPKISGPTTTSRTSSIWKKPSTLLVPSEKDEHTPFTTICIQATAPTYHVSTITVTSVLVKTSTVLLTTYLTAASSTCAAAESTPIIASSTTQLVPATESRIQDPSKDNTKDGRKKNNDDHLSSAKFSGKRLSCFSCQFDEAVAKEFSMECNEENCASGQSYCADAILQHNGRRFIKKSCASSQYCNSTMEQCVHIFKHTADFTACHVNCCGGKLCNPYNLASSITVSSFIILAIGILSLI